MRRASVCGLLLLCVDFYFVNTGSSSHNVHRRDTSPKKNFSGVVGTSMKVSPTWYLSVGDTVVINCTMHTDKGNYSDKMDLQLIWTKMGLGERTKKVLVSQRVSQGFSYVLGPVTHEHQGVYTCDDDGTFPDVYVHHWHSMIWVEDAAPKASIDVISHNRNQFFHNESFTLACQLPDDNTEWKMMKFNSWVGDIAECPNQESSGRRLSCTTRSVLPWADALFWCENPAGERSNALNITKTISRTQVLQSPTLPVLEGEDVLLRCLHRDKTTMELTSNFRTAFSKNDRVVSYEDDGNYTQKAVTKADEGLYKCFTIQDRETHDSWISVKARPNGDQKKNSGIETS